MNLEHVAQFASFGLGLLLITKLLSLRLHRVYYAFCALLASDLIGSALWLSRFEWRTSLREIDYRYLWLADRLLVWIFTLWTVALLLQSVLGKFPGILSISRRVFRYSWIIATLAGIVSAVAEYSASHTAGNVHWISFAVRLGLICERVVASIALLAILLIFGFLLWFPVRIPRNLAYLCSGFVVYFSTLTFTLLARSFWSEDFFRLASTISSVIGAACYAYWTIFISGAGESVPARMNIEWRPADQVRLLERLEGLNESLLRAARR